MPVILDSPNFRSFRIAKRSNANCCASSSLGCRRTILREQEGTPMRILALVLMAFAADCAPAQTPYCITKTYPLGGDGCWDYIVPDPPSHRLFIARQKPRHGGRREQNVQPDHERSLLG